VLEPLFVDTSYVLALINRRDQNHVRAQELARQFAGHPLVITNAILFEIGNALCASFRSEAAQTIREFQTDPLCELVWLTEEGMEAALSLFESRRDKEWSLVDCASFQVMQSSGVSSALTFDHHFEQAGFRALGLSTQPDSTP
jgi:predicted nucleic acid-binding protein